MTERGREPVVIEVKIDEPNTPNLSGEAVGKSLTNWFR